MQVSHDVVANIYMSDVLTLLRFIKAPGSCYYISISQKPSGSLRYLICFYHTYSYVMLIYKVPVLIA
jgi:hypothetical protein